MSVFWKIIKWVLLFSAALIAQTSIVPRIAIFGIYPDLPMILLVIFAVENGKMAGIWGGFLLGLLIDVYSVGILGVNALAKTIIGCTGGLLERKNVSISPVLLLIFLFIACIANDLIIFIPNIYGAGESFVDLSKYLLVSSLPRAIYTAFIAAIILVILDNLPSQFRR